MDIYTQKSRWKWMLAALAVAIIGISAVFTAYLTQKLAEEERNKVEQYAFAQKQISDPEMEGDLTLHLQILNSNTTIPVIIENNAGEIDAAVNFGECDSDFEYLKEELKKNESLGSGAAAKRRRRQYLL